jgi:hypothetical protein
MAIKKRPDPPEVVQARHERMDYLAEKVRASIVRRRARIERMRAEAGLPPMEEPPWRV